MPYLNLCGCDCEDLDPDDPIVITPISCAGDTVLLPSGLNISIEGLFANCLQSWQCANHTLFFAPSPCGPWENKSYRVNLYSCLSDTDIFCTGGYRSGSLSILDIMSLHGAVWGTEECRLAAEAVLCKNRFKFFGTYSCETALAPPDDIVTYHAYYNIYVTLELVASGPSSAVIYPEFVYVCTIPSGGKTAAYGVGFCAVPLQYLTDPASCLDPPNYACPAGGPSTYSVILPTPYSGCADQADFCCTNGVDPLRICISA